MNFFNQLMASLSTISTGNLDTIIGAVQNVMYALFGLLTVGAVILSIVLAYKFFTADSEDKRKNAKKQLIYALIGVIVLIVMLAFAPQIVNLIKDAAKGN